MIFNLYETCGVYFTCDFTYFEPCEKFVNFRAHCTNGVF